MFKQSLQILLKQTQIYFKVPIFFGVQQLASVRQRKKKHFELKTLNTAPRDERSPLTTNV